VDSDLDLWIGSRSDVGGCILAFQNDAVSIVYERSVSIVNINRVGFSSMRKFNKIYFIQKVRIKFIQIRIRNQIRTKMVESTTLAAIVRTKRADSI
jgi:hypothetical protein